MTTFKEDSLLSATAFGLGGVGYHPGSCVEDITEMQRKIARSQDFAFQKVNTLSQEHAKKNEIYKASMSHSESMRDFHF